jgi:tetratricopeptide (TPR) repeat protein
MKLARQIIILNPKDPTGWMQLGRGFILSELYDSALAALQFANALNPGSYHILMSLGQAYYKLHDLEAARRLWSQAASIDTTMFDCYASLGLIAHDLREWRDAQDLFRQSVSRPGAPGWVYVQLGNAYAINGHLDSARWAYSSAIAMGFDKREVAGAVQRFPDLSRSLNLDTLEVAP